MEHLQKQSPNIGNREITPWLEYFTGVVAIELTKVKDKVRKLSVDSRLKVKFGEQVALTERGLEGLVILRAIAKHHYGPYGFLTEGVDWNDHVGQKHHIGQAKYAAIQYTEPFLNNQHIVEPTLFYLKNLAHKTSRGAATEWSDLEGNLLLRQ